MPISINNTNFIHNENTAKMTQIQMWVPLYTGPHPAGDDGREINNKTAVGGETFT